MPRSGPADAPLDGSAVFAAKLGDTVISAAGVSAARPALGFSLFTDQLGSAATGLALANPGAGTATVTLTLRDKNGGPVASATRPLAPYEHTALFTHELFSQVEGIDAFEGVIDVANTSEVAAVTLRFDPQDLVFTMLPVLVGSGSTRIFFPHVADGGGLRTTFILMNNLDGEAQGILHAFHSDGTPWALPLTDGRTGRPFGEDVLRIPVHGTVRIVCERDKAPDEFIRGQQGL